MKKFLMVLMCLSAVSVFAAIDPQIPEKLNRAFDEANKTFTYNGKPINPRAIEELLTWISDSGPGPVAIDLAGTDDTNRYFGEFEKKENGSIYINLNSVNPSSQEGDPDKGYFSYQRIGTLIDNIHVVETWENGGGSGVFGNLLLIRFKVDYEYDEDGSRRYILVMQRLGELSLCDRYDGPVQVRTQDNSIQIGPGQCVGNDKFDKKVIVLK